MKKALREKMEYTSLIRASLWANPLLPLSQKYRINFELDQTMMLLHKAHKKCCDAEKL